MTTSPTLALEFSGVPGDGVFLASAYAAVGTARACIASEIMVRATPEGIRVELPGEFEPRRVARRLQLLRDWSHDEENPAL